MRKSFAIVMLLVYLFNLTGYRFFFQYYIDQSNQQIVKQADNGGYTDAELKEIKVELNLPYMTDWSGYERYDGEIELNGVHYNYVKRKVFQDTLYLLCLPNETKTQLSKEKADYAAKANDGPSKKENNNPSAKKSILLNEFRQQPLGYDFSIFRIESPDNVSYAITRFTDTFIDAIGHPPRIS